jgi:hypothetical protein
MNELAINKIAEENAIEFYLYFFLFSGFLKGGDK